MAEAQRSRLGVSYTGMGAAGAGNQGRGGDKAPGVGAMFVRGVIISPLSVPGEGRHSVLVW